MFSSVFNLIKSVLFGVLLNDYLKRNFSDKYNEIFILLSYKVIYLYSKGQIIYNNFFIQIKTIIDSNPQLKQLVNDIYKKNIKRNQICQIKNDNINIKYYIDNSEKYFDHDENSIYLFSDNEKAIENKCVNKVILHSQPFLTEYEVSNIQFMLVEVIINDISYKINLKTDDYNYYIVDNILDLNFFKYYLYNYQICTLTSETKSKIDKIMINIIDQNVVMKKIEISHDKFIIIKKENYIY